MRVGIDATGWPNPRGDGRVVRNAVTRLVELDRDTTYVLYIDAQTAARVRLPPNAEQQRLELREAPSAVLTANSRRSVGDLLRLTRSVDRRLDAFLFLSVYTYFPVFAVPTVVGLHDIIWEQFPESALPTLRARAAWRFKQGMAVRRARRLFTVSETSRTAIVDRFGIAPERLAVVPWAPDPVFRPRSRSQIARELASLGLQPEDIFFLYAGGVGRHKNVERLLDGYALLRGKLSKPPRLVLVGSLDGPYLSAAMPLRRRVASLGLEQQVLLPGFVSDRLLACLYSAATAVVLPSLAEGFGLPAVEAAACGAATVLSDIGAHRETLGDAALYFPPTDVAALERQLARVLDDPELCRSLGERGQQAVSRLSWDITANRLREVISDAAAKRPY